MRIANKAHVKIHNNSTFQATSGFIEAILDYMVFATIAIKKRCCPSIRCSRRVEMPYTAQIDTLQMRIDIYNNALF